MDEIKQRLKEIEARRNELFNEYNTLANEYCILKLKDIGADNLVGHYISITDDSKMLTEYMFVEDMSVDSFRCDHPRVVLNGQYFSIRKFDDGYILASYSNMYPNEFRLEDFECCIKLGRFKVISREEFGEALGRFLNDTKEAATDRFNKCEEDDDAQ